MTGGTVVVLGPTDANFAAGMTGGMAFVYDPDRSFDALFNPESVVVSAVASPYWADHLRALVEEHAETTGSLVAKDLLRDWDRARADFRQVCPKEMLNRLEAPLEAVA
jgi:glutamate synthase (NADPH/NADH) large chain